jgi:hypothetical protein
MTSRDALQPIPADHEAERKLLGGLFMDSAALRDVRAVIEADAFDLPRHRVVYQAMLQLADSRKAIELLTMKAHLEQTSSLEKVGGLAFLAELADSAATAAYVLAHAELLATKARQRALIRTCERFARRVYDGDDVEVVVQELDQAVRKLRPAVAEPAASLRTAWPELDPAALHGLAGEFVDLVLPHTEADPVALLVQFHASFGNALGSGPHFTVEGDRHGGNLYACLVGDTASGRKGTSAGRVRKLFELVDSDWATERNRSGVSTGEGLAFLLRDGSEDGSDPGVDDKRLMIYEPEFARVLGVMDRQGNTLSPILRDLWDGGSTRTLGILTKGASTRVTGGHLSLVAHITKDELLRTMSGTEASNGFGNRFAWFVVRRSKLLPDGGADLPWPAWNRLGSRVKSALERGREIGAIERDHEARELWHEVYGELTAARPGMLGALLARGAPQVLRLALIYAVLDSEPVIRAVHLRAALGLWAYASESTALVFGDRLGDPLAEDVLRALRSVEAEGMTRSEIHGVHHHNNRPGEVARVLALLEERQLAFREKQQTRGRSAERWFAGRPSTQERKKTEERRKSEKSVRRKTKEEAIPDPSFVDSSSFVPTYGDAERSEGEGRQNGGGLRYEADPDFEEVGDL